MRRMRDVYEKLADGSNVVPLKEKYLVKKHPGFKSKSNNSKAKPKTLWKLLEENAKKRGKK